jgi:DNA adenine methylase
MTEELKPIVKWAGGKRWLVPRVEKIWQHYSDRRLVEPFCGGLAISLGLQPKRALLNDINPYLINLYKQIQEGIEIDVYNLENEEDRYYYIRNLFNQAIEAKVQDKNVAVMFYYLNRTGFNGLCRFNKKGGYNVPFGKYKTVNYLETFESHQRVFEDWEFSSTTFEHVDVQREDFLYIDPPYDDGFTQYSKEGFSWEDQVKLANWIVEQGVPAITSNLATDRIIDLYSGLGFKVEFIEAPRRISCNGDRRPVMEMFATYNIKEVGDD